MDTVLRLRHSQFLRHNTVFFFGSIAVGALNYLYYPVLGRMLKPAAFGEVQTLVSLFLQLSIFLTVLGLIAVNIVANTTSEERRNALVLEFEKLGLLISAFFLIATFVFQSQLQSFFHFDSAWPFTILALSIAITVPFTMRSSFLRGKHRFGQVSLANLLGAGGKLIFSILFVILGWGTSGAIGGLVAAQLVAFVLVAWWARNLGLRRGADMGRLMPNMRVLKPELRYGGLVLICSLVVTLQYSIDVIFIKHYFDARTAGLYAGIASVARIIFFLTASISQVLMPSVKLDNTARQNSQLLYKSFILFGILSVPTLALFALAPKLIIEILMGSSYDSLAHVLPRLSLAVFVVSILNLLVSYYLALRRYGLIVITVIGGLITYVWMLANHSTVTSVVNGLLYGSLVMLIFTGLWAWIAKLREESI